MSTRDKVLASMLEDLSSEYDKRPGSPIYDALAPAAAQFARTDDDVDKVKGKLSTENLNGQELAQRVKERTGITRRPATCAIGFVTLIGTGEVREGDLFETPAGVQFRSTETKDISLSGIVSIEAVIPGIGGIVAAGTITLFPVTLAGFTSVTNPQPTHDGFDKESDADLLQRYYERIRTPATSGNKAHYLNWAKEVNGVGDARVIPLWRGDNTVKVVIIDANRHPASDQLVLDVQNHIDPKSEGLGNGEAPIGAHTTVISAEGNEINIDVTVTLSAGYTKEDAERNIASSNTKYLKDIAFVEDIVSYAKVGAAILNSNGVADYSNLTINSGTSNITIGTEEVAILGKVTVHVA